MKLRTTATLMLLFGCATALFPQGQPTQDARLPSAVSLIQVIANPNGFNEQTIKVIGFLAPGGGTDMSVGLFVSEADGRHHKVQNSIVLMVDERKVKALMGGYVTLTGTYHAPDPRAIAYGYNGYIDHIHDMNVWHAGNNAK